MNSEFSRNLYKYFSLKGEIGLPGLGVLSLIRVPSTNDFANKLFYSPVFRFHFEQTTEYADVSRNAYLRSKLNIGDGELEQMCNSFSHHVAEQLELNGRVEWEGIGFFALNDAKRIEFFPLKELESFTGKIPYEHVVRESYSHDVLTGDRMQTSEDLHQYFEDQRRSIAWPEWKIASVVLISIAAAVITARFFLGNFSFLDARYNRLETSESAITYSLKK